MSRLGENRPTERKLLVDTGSDDAWIDYQAVGHVIKSQKDRVRQQELGILAKTLPLGTIDSYHFRNIHATDGTWWVRLVTGATAVRGK